MIRHWYETNVRALQQLFGEVAYDHRQFYWVGIRSFALPPVFQESHSSLLITTPGANIENHDGYKFYLDLGLTRQCRDRERHIFENHGYNDLYKEGWARLSYHLDVFRPTPDVKSGDNLVHVVQSVYNFLGQKW